MPHLRASRLPIMRKGCSASAARWPMPGVPAFGATRAMRLARLVAGRARLRGLGMARRLVGARFPERACGVGRDGAAARCDCSDDQAQGPRRSLLPSGRRAQHPEIRESFGCQVRAASSGARCCPTSSIRWVRRVRRSVSGAAKWFWGRPPIRGDRTCGRVLPGRSRGVDIACGRSPQTRAAVRRLASREIANDVCPDLDLPSRRTPAPHWGTRATEAEGVGSDARFYVRWRRQARRDGCSHHGARSARLS
jgi:hypothetical protein